HMCTQKHTEAYAFAHTNTHTHTHTHTHTLSHSPHTDGEHQEEGHPAEHEAAHHDAQSLGRALLPRELQQPQGEVRPTAHGLVLRRRGGGNDCAFQQRDRRMANAASLLRQTRPWLSLHTRPLRNARWRQLSDKLY